tara:strand:- start:2449 stop:3024 length:576 start_codon:yes stop_codon:yes gene_type:complete
MKQTTTPKENYMAKDKKIVLKDVEVSWAKLQEPVAKYQSETQLEYTVAVKMNEQLERIMTDFKLNKKVRDGKDTSFDGARHIQIGVDETTLNGWTRYGEVYDKNGEPTQSLIGNGSRVNLFVSIGDSSYGNVIKLGHINEVDSETKSLYFDFCQVLELVDYEKPSVVVKAKAIEAAVDAADLDEMEIAFEV